MDDLPLNERKEALALLGCHLLKTHRNPNVPQWLTANYTRLTKEVIPVIKFANATAFPFTLALLNLSLLTEVPADVRLYANRVEDLMLSR